MCQQVPWTSSRLGAHRMTQVLRRAALRPGGESRLILRRACGRPPIPIVRLVAKYRGISAAAVDRMHRVFPNGGAMFCGGGSAPVYFQPVLFRLRFGP
jgi:hypothetical protein